MAKHYNDDNLVFSQCKTETSGQMRFLLQEDCQNTVLKIKAESIIL